MKIILACIGKLKEKYFREAFEAYSRQISKHYELALIEIAGMPAPESLSLAEEDELKRKESAKLYSRIRPGSFIIALDPAGKRTGSADFAKKIASLEQAGTSEVVFTIGGSLGLHVESLAKSDFRMSLSRMTFPHQLARLILAEQIARRSR